MVTAAEFQMILLMFDAKVCEYKVMGDDRTRDSLPFKDFPNRV